MGTRQGPVVMTVRYSCNDCGLDDAACEVPVRGVEEEVVAWVERIMYVLARDHDAKTACAGLFPREVAERQDPHLGSAAHRGRAGAMRVFEDEWGPPPSKPPRPPLRAQPWPEIPRRTVASCPCSPTMPRKMSVRGLRQHLQRTHPKTWRRIVIAAGSYAGADAGKRATRGWDCEFLTQVIWYPAMVDTIKAENRVRLQRRKAKRRRCRPLP